VIPERKHMIVCAEAVEHAADQLGWDQHPVLGFVRHVGAGLIVGEYPAQPAWIHPENPVVGLQALADAVMKHAADSRRRLTEHGLTGFGDDICAFWFCCEARIVDDGKEIEGMAALHNPAAKEARQVFVVDCAGRIYQVNRHRGRDRVETVVIEPGAGEHLRYGEEIALALRRLLLGAGTNMSTGAIDMEKVAQVGE